MHGAHCQSRGARLSSGGGYHVDHVFAVSRPSAPIFNPLTTQNRASQKLAPHLCSFCPQSLPIFADPPPHSRHARRSHAAASAPRARRDRARPRAVGPRRLCAHHHKRLELALHARERRLAETSAMPGIYARTRRASADAKAHVTHTRTHAHHADAHAHTRAHARTHAASHASGRPRRVHACIRASATADICTRKRA
eukprot:5788596-Pleurochrysis_carterae.AAC.2